MREKSKRRGLREEDDGATPDEGRRKFIRSAGLGVAALAIGQAGLSGSCASGSGPQAPVASDASAPVSANFAPDLEISLKAAPADVQLLPGRKTGVWTYQGEVLRGDVAALQSSAGGYLGPTLRLLRGQKVRIRFDNQLPENSIIHWHGLHVPAEMDGHPRSVIDPGKSFVYKFEVGNRAGTFWYHPHPHDRTGPQVYRGLAGFLLISDDEEAKIGLPSGEYDIPLALQDRMLDADNQLVYLQGGMMERMTGFLGDRILVNGRPDFTLSVATRAYRLRVLNASNSRIYKLAWKDNTPLTVIATDGGLLERPVVRSFVTLAPAERIELLVDLRNRAVGDELELRSLEFSGTDMGMMGRGGGMGRGMGRGMGGGGSRSGQVLPNGSSFTVMKLQVKRKEQETFTLPERLSTFQRHRLEDAVNHKSPRSISLSMRGMNLLLNNRTFRMEEVAENEAVKMGTTEVWEFVNETGGMGMMGGMNMAHPMHMHAVQFLVIDRNVAPDFREGWETVRQGFVDEGWKDTVLVMPGERVRVLVRFEKYPGLFLYHCHNLEHEDMGMMRNYMIRA